MMRTSSVSPLASLLFGAILLLDIAGKKDADIQELLWACYLASLALVIGTAFRICMLVDASIVFFVGLGTPSWLLGLFFTARPSSLSSYLMHLVPIGIALLHLRGVRHLGRSCFIGAWCLFAVPFSLTPLLCDPWRNINLTEGLRLGDVQVLGGTWLDRTVLMLIALCCSRTAYVLINHWLNLRSSTEVLPDTLNLA